jgi:F5/8 type C domain/FG-GAP repeat
MFTVFFKKRDKNVIMTGILTVVLLFPLLSTVPSSAAFAQISNYQDNSSSISSSFETSSNVTTIKNVTQKVGQDNYTKLELESLSTNSMFFENETGTLSNITDNSANITNISNAAAEGSIAVTGDFNGDGSDDLAIGAPDEDVEVGVSCTTNLPIASVTASGNDGNVPENVLDIDLNTRWSSQGIGQFITTDLGSTKKICSVDIAWFRGNERQYHFVISTSTDGTTFTNVLGRDSTGTTLNSEKYNIPPTNARYVRIIVNGNTANNWASITEVDVFGRSSTQIISGTGAVNVIYGSSRGLSDNEISAGDGRPDQIWTQIANGNEAWDRFGSSLTSGDFNSDGFSDLAIGVPNEDLGTIGNAGAVDVIYGSSNGLSVTAKPIQIWSQNSPQIEGNAEPGDRFGQALTTGDFNSDGFSDLVIGVPAEDIVNVSQINIGNAGAFNLIYGSSSGLNASTTPDELWSQFLVALGGDPELDDNFGATLTSGDFDKNGFSDLAIGVPGESVGISDNAGTIDVIYGAEGGFGINIQKWTQDSPDVEDGAEAGDRFGGALAAGDFNEDGAADLAIGVAGEDLGNLMEAGAVNVLYGSEFFGLWPTAIGPDHGSPDQMWTQDSPSIEDDAENRDCFGCALATGDFNKDGATDLAIGVTAEGVGTNELAGAINVIYGSSQGLAPVSFSPGNGRTDQIWTQDSTNVEDVAEGIDLFGFSLATGDFNNDEISDLAIGVPLEDIDSIGNAGAVNVIYGSTGVVLIQGGLSATVPVGGNGREDQMWTQDSSGIEDSVELDDRFGSSLG